MPKSIFMGMSEKEIIAKRLLGISQYLSGSFTGNFVELERENLKFKILIYPATGYPKLRQNYGVGAYPRLEINLNIRGVPQFSVRHESIADTIAKTLRLNNEIQTGDLKFDRSFFISTNNTEWGKSFFLLPNIRTGISDMLNLGFDYFISENDTLSLNKLIQSLDDCADSLLKEAVSRMSNFASAYFKSFEHS